MSNPENIDPALSLDGEPALETAEHGEPEQVYSAATNEEAEVIRATLEAAGIPAFLRFATSNPVLGAVDDRLGENWMNGVMVAPSDAEAARAVLSAVSPSEAELADEAAQDPMTLEQAEANVRND